MIVVPGHGQEFNGVPSAIYTAEGTRKIVRIAGTPTYTPRSAAGVKAAKAKRKQQRIARRKAR